MFKILVAEDDGGAARLMLDTLADAGYETLLARDGLQALELVSQRHVDLLVLDLMLPRLDDFAALTQLRRAGSALPVLVLSAREAQADKCRAQAACARRLQVGSTTLFYDDLAVEWDGRRTELPRKEFLLLYKLLSCPDKTFTRRQLMDEVWDMDTDSDEHTVNVHINRLRDKFGENRDFAIVTVRGLGYKAVRL